MIITYKTINKIKFPVFQLPNSNWSTQDGLMFIDREIVDDKNMRGETLGLRRIQSPFTMMKLNRSVNNIIGIIKQIILKVIHVQKIV